MARIPRMNCFAATLVVVYLISGCQSPNSKWSTAWKERMKPKPNFQGVDGPEEKVTYWPNKPASSNPKLTDPSSSLKDRLVRKSDQSKRDAQLAEIIREGDQLRKNSQYEDARLVYTKALMIAPENPDIHHRLAIVADKQHQYALADEHYQAALRVRPRDPKLLNDMGYSYFLRGNMQLAETTLKEALSIDRTHRIAMSNLGTIYSQQNRFDEAWDMFRNGMSEAEAQQALAQLYTQNQTQVASGQMPNQGHSNTSPVITAKADGPRDLSKWTQEEIQVEMARLNKEAKMRRMQADQQMLDQTRAVAAEEQRSQQQQMAQNNPNLPRGNQPGNYLAQNANNAGPMGNQQGFGTAQSQQNVMPGTGSMGQGNLPYSNNAQGQAMNPVYSNGPSSQAMNGMSNDRPVNPAASDQAPSGAPGGNQMARIIRGPGNPSQSYRPGDQPMQQGWDQRSPNGSTNNLPSSGGISSASQMATQLGMSAGPGSMFPVMQSQESDNAAMGNQNWPAQSIEQISNMGGPGSGNDAQFPSIAPMSPVNNWSSPANGAPQWQSDSKSSSEWSNETIPNNGTGSNQNNQGGNRRLNGFDSLQPGLNANPTRSENEISRPYNGSWPPNSNSQPQRQSSNISINGRSPETLEIMGINPNNNNSEFGGSPSNQNGSSGSAANPAANSLPMYPYAPNR